MVDKHEPTHHLHTPCSTQSKDWSCLKSLRDLLHVSKELFPQLPQLWNLVTSGLSGCGSMAPGAGFTTKDPQPNK